LDGFHTDGPATRAGRLSPAPGAPSAAALERPGGARRALQPVASSRASPPSLAVTQ